MDKFLIVDGNSIANRAFYAMPYLSNREGKPSGAVYGFANILIKLILQEKPSHIAVAFDHARKTFRNDIYADYKGQRKPAPPELIAQFPLIKDMLSKMGVKTYEFENIEADDIIGTIVKNSSCPKILLSGDRDLFQLIDNNTIVWFPRKGVSEVDKVTLSNLKETFGVAEPYQVVEAKALMGDSSDNIPGVKGIGEKTAQSLIEKYNDLDGVYKNLDIIKGKIAQRLANDKDNAYMSKLLATIKTDCDINFNIEECKFTFPFSQEVYQFFKSMDFNSLIRNDMLFDKLSILEIKRTKTQKVSLTVEALNKICEQKTGIFCYNFSNMTFYCGEGEIYFLDHNYDMFSSPLSFEQVCLGLKRIFEDQKILKLTFSSKEDMHILDKFGIELNNFIDLAVQNYVINAGSRLSNDNIEVDEYLSLHNLFNKQIEELGVENIYRDIEVPLIKVLKNMEDYGFKINENRLDELSGELENKLSALQEEIFVEADEEFNINSPKQVAYILFEKLGIKSYNNRKQSTSVGVLDELRYIPIVAHILDWRKVSKLKNTYIDVYKNICKSTGPIIHTRFNQTLTSTGRLSSSEPNLQNIPTRNEEGRELRKLFISKFEGGKITSADYNQIELRLLADMSGEEHLIEAYKKGDDIHTITASQIFGVDVKDVTADMRREAKAVNFGIIYGISDYGLSHNIKSTVMQAKKYIESYFDRYPKVKNFMNDNVAYAKEHGLVKTKFGRVRKIPEISSSKYMVRTFGERVAMNMPLQGTASDIIKMAMNDVFDEFEKRKLKSQLILQIHDELIVDTFPGEEDIVKDILTDKMQNVTTLKVPLLVSIGQGESLYDCK